MNHSKGSTQFAIPCHKGMHRSATVDVLEAVVRTFNDMQQPARRSATGIILGGKHDSIAPHHQSERIPKTTRDTTQAVPVACDVEDSTFSLSSKLAIVGSSQGPIFAEVLPKGKQQASIVVPRHTTQSVVWVVGEGIKRSDGLLYISHTIPIGVFDSEDSIALCQVNPSIFAEQELHRRLGLIVENLLVLTITIEDQYLILAWTCVAIGRKMGMACD
jgi:hypothetical protein